jgi:uncharacterized membrane protein HdeD (DUF308 family)
MSTLSNIYRKGLISMVAGIGLVAYGAIASAHIALLVGLVVIVWGVVRFRGFRSRAGQ